MLFTTPDAVPDSNLFVRLWIHETTRVYSDKLVDEADREVFRKHLLDAIKKVEVGQLDVNSGILDLDVEGLRFRTLAKN